MKQIENRLYLQIPGSLVAGLGVVNDAGVVSSVNELEQKGGFSKEVARGIALWKELERKRKEDEEFARLISSSPEDRSEPPMLDLD